MSDAEFFRRIIVPLDFHEADEDEEPAPGEVVLSAGTHRIAFAGSTLHAVDLASAIARRHNGTLRLVHATPPMQTSNIYTGPARIASQVLDEIHDRARNTSLDAMREVARKRCEGTELELIAGPGHPMQMVLAEAKTWPADLIVMSASGRSRVARFFVGSTADRVIREAPCPVMVIPAHRD